MDCQGRSGGLSMWWKGDLEVELQSVSKGHINVLVRTGMGEGASYITGFIVVWDEKQI